MPENLENIILFDWFSMTSKIDDFEAIIKLLGLSHCHWTDGFGARGYQFRKYFNSISIHYCGNNNTVWLEMSGQGCRAYETFSTCCDWNKLFNLVLNDRDNYHLTRLDIAYDDWTGVLNIKTLNRYSRNQNIVTKFRDYGVDMSYVKEDITLYYGSKKSDVLFRCYNKAAERNREDVKHWIRFEMQLRDNHAFNFLSNLSLIGDVGTVFLSVLNNYMRFVEPSNDSHKDRWKTSAFWKKFIGSVVKISLYTKKDVEYNYFNVKNLVQNQYGNVIDVVLQLDGTAELEKLIRERRILHNPKYDKIIDDELERRSITGEGTPF